MSYTPTYAFTGPKRKEQRSGKCPGCGKPAKRSRTFEHTVNPWNRNADGEPKTWQEVAADVKAEAEAWDPPAELFECAACERERTKPPAGETVPFPVERQERGAEARDRVRQWLDWVERHGLPFSEPSHWAIRGGGASLHVWSRDLVALAHAVGVETVTCSRSDGDLRVGFRGEIFPGTELHVTGHVPANGRERPKAPELSVDELAAFISETGTTQYEAAASVRRVVPGGDGAQ